MSATLRLSIAGLGAVVQALEADLDLEPHGAAARFAVDDVAADLTVRARWTTALDRVRTAPVFDSGALWQLHRSTGGWLFQFESPSLGPAPYKMAWVNSTFTDTDLALNRPAFAHQSTVYPLEFPLDELLFIHMLSRGRGVELHGCAVVDTSGEASLFVGQSGAGKSTTARLWAAEPGVTILSDDRVVVRQVGQELMAFGTPWHGDEVFAAPGPAVLSRIFFLKHGSINRVTPTSGADATARLFACSFVPFYDRHALEFALALFTTIADRIACSELEFAPNRSAVDFVREHA